MKDRHSSTSPSLREKKRADILEAALREFDARGFRETSMDRVAASANVSKRTVYNHFCSKNALYDAIVEELSDRIQQVTGHRYDPALPLERQLRRIGEQVLDMLVAPCFQTLARVAMVEMIRSPESARSTYELVRGRLSGLARWLDDATRDGRLQVDDPDWAAEQFMGLIKTFAFWPQVLGGQPAPDTATRERILDSAVALFVGDSRSGAGGR